MLFNISFEHKHDVYVLPKVKNRVGRPKAIRKISKRNYEILNMFTNEMMTLQEIGNKYGVSRERIRQIIKSIEPDGAIGGNRLRVAIEKSHKPKKDSIREKKCIELYGCSLSERDRYGKPHEKHSLTNAYMNQKNSAKMRGIEFNLTLTEWIKIWADSGHLHERGKGKGKFCMTRICDIGPYSVENVQIKTHEENSKESRLMDKIYHRESIKIFNLNGSEYTLKELSEIFKIKRKTIDVRIKKGLSVLEACTTPVKKTNRW